ncbi:MAG: cell wall hydrolase [Clostridiales Family XIII bacterium]|jgi:spore germination cell wall hydrolase CwlJ-like protein|nr:cell wall hydrolase [Clostridiales Family XIII bacterium]
MMINKIPTAGVYEKVLPRQGAPAAVKEVLQIAALSLVCVLAALMIFATLAEPRAEFAEEEPAVEAEEPAVEADPAPAEAFVPTAAPGPTAEEIALLERVVTAEAGNQPYEGMMAVAEVALNRAGLWGMTPAEVLTAPHQFAAPCRGEASERAKTAVRDALAGIRVFKEPVTHFYNGSVEPSWAKGKAFAGKIGDHFFYY